MRARLEDEGGYALVSAIAVLAIIAAFGLSAMKYADMQQHAAGAERTRESGFNQAEAVLNAQVFQLARAWPSSSSPATWQCVPTTTGAGTASTTCPNPTSLSSSFTNADYTTAPGCTQPAWQTTVQDDDTANGGTQYYEPVAMNPATHAQIPSDANNNNSVWVRATTWTRCRKQTVVVLATRALIPLQWPTAVISADYFATGNNGKKVIINTQGPPDPSGASRQPGNVSLRCSRTDQTSYPGGKCQKYVAGQVAPDTVPSSSAGDTPVVGGSQLTSLKEQATASGTYYAAGSCTPASIASLPAGTVVYVDGPCNLSVSGNSAANPIVLVIAQGSFSLTGNSTFYGLVYAANTNASSNVLVSLGGCARVQGLIAVDGPGGVNVGSCKQNLIYDPTVLPLLKTYGGIVAAKNSFRVLPGTAP